MLLLCLCVVSLNVLVRIVCGVLCDVVCVVCLCVARSFKVCVFCLQLVAMLYDL